MFEVIYYPMCGKGKNICQNKKKLAEVIAIELGVEAEDIRNRGGLAKDSFVVLGCGCFADNPRGILLEFIANNDFRGRQVALFIMLGLAHLSAMGELHYT